MTEKNEKNVPAETIETERVESGSEFAWSPAVDICESGDAFIIEANMPGVGRDGVDVQIDKGVLTIRGRCRPKSIEGVRQLHEEFVGADFYRAFELGEEIDDESVEAVMTDGVLTVTLPRAARARTRRIDVK